LIVIFAYLLQMSKNCIWDDDCWNAKKERNLKKPCCEVPTPSQLFWVNFVQRPKLRSSIKRKNVSPPLFDVTGEWIILYHHGGTVYPYKASFRQNGVNVSGRVNYPENGAAQLTGVVTEGLVTGLAMKISLEFSGSCEGKQYMDGLIDPEKRQMAGTWFRDSTDCGSCGEANGSWTASKTEDILNPAPSCTSQWVRIANENDTVWFNDDVDVAFGFPTEFFEPNDGFYNTIINTSGNITFNVETFGDPIFGEIKAGFYKCHN